MVSIRFFVHVFYLALFIFCTLNGAIILKTGAIRVPFTDNKQLEGIGARMAGSGLMIFGLWALLKLIHLMNDFGIQGGMDLV